MRYVATGAARGVGLRGGLFTVNGAAVLHFRLHGIRFVPDARVDGTGTYRGSDGAVRSQLTVTVGRRRFLVRAIWTQATSFARARLGRAVLSLPAP